MDLALITAKQVFELFILILSGVVIGKIKMVNEEGKGMLSNLLIYFVVPFMIINSYMSGYNAEILKNMGRMLFYSILTICIGMAASMGAPAVSAEESTTDYGGITLTLMNSKPEIQNALEKVTSEWGAEHNVTFDVYKTDAPQDTLAQKYASGDAPVISICDPSNVTEMGEEKFLDLSNENGLLMVEIHWEPKSME